MTCSKSKQQRVSRPASPTLAAILQRGYADLVRYLLPYNTHRSKELLEEAAALLLARLLFIRSLETRGIEQQQLAPLLRGWQRISRRHDLLVLLAGLARTLHRTYGGPILAPAPLDQLECEPTPLEPLLEALLDETLAPTLANSIATAQAWEAVFAPRPRPWSNVGADALLDLLALSPDRRKDLPVIIDLAPGGGSLLALIAGRLLETGSKAQEQAPAELLAALYGSQSSATLRWGTMLALSTAILQRRARLPQSLRVGAAPPAATFDAALLYPASPQEGQALLEQASYLLKPNGILGLLLPIEAAEAATWEALRNTLFAGWSIAAILPAEANYMEARLLALSARPEDDTKRRAETRINRKTTRRAGTAAAIRQGALAELPGKPLRIELTETVERALAKIAIGRPLAEVALVWRIKQGSQPPARGAQAVRATLPMVLLNPTPEPPGWTAQHAESWPTDGGLVIQPLALLAAHKGSGARLTTDQRAALAPYSLPLLLALLRSRLLALYRRLMIGRQHALTQAELRALPVPYIDPDNQAQQQLLATIAAASNKSSEQELAELYGLTNQELRALESFW